MSEDSFGLNWTHLDQPEFHLEMTGHPYFGQEFPKNKANKQNYIKNYKTARYCFNLSETGTGFTKDLYINPDMPINVYTQFCLNTAQGSHTALCRALLGYLKV